ncbi:MAG TPA: hypothetical protein VHT24_00465 [Pseudacidobacterium sp.]|jgi:hypothetical protein|nr:hypothetical protein [Pseudacidobacterium sp.]
MEADWSVEIGADLPVIAVPWEGFVDLRENLARVREISEAVVNSALAEALIKLNAPESPVFTSKADAWVLAADDIDPFEFDASPQEAQTGRACYIDIIARDNALFSNFATHEKWVQAATLHLRKIALRRSRTDFVVRPAFVDGREGFAITFYVLACAIHENEALSIFQDALNHAIAATIETSVTAGE